MSSEKLIYVDDALPGITRKGAGRGWAYYDAKGALIKEQAEKKRLNAVALPPAYHSAWFCPAHNGHILATGIDAKGRKQYRYHPDFRAMKEGEKFDGSLTFGKLLPLVRKRVAEDMDSEHLTRVRVVASVVRLLDLGFVRIGNEAYARRNNNFGATTLRQRHAEVSGDDLHLSYRGKSGKQRDVSLTDEALTDVIEQMRDLPGQDLFQYLDTDGERNSVGSSDVNDYLREAMGEDFTAKNFRTWHASVLAFGLLAENEDAPSLKSLLEVVSDQLGNTPAVARRSYIHPAVIDVQSRHAEWRERLELPRSAKYLSRHERCLIALLEASPAAEELLVA